MLKTACMGTEGAAGRLWLHLAALLSRRLLPSPSLGLHPCLDDRLSLSLCVCVILERKLHVPARCVAPLSTAAPSIHPSGEGQHNRCPILERSRMFDPWPFSCSLCPRPFCRLALVGPSVIMSLPLCFSSPQKQGEAWGGVGEAARANHREREVEKGGG